jgi:hypothetical protein
MPMRTVVVVVERIVMAVVIVVLVGMRLGGMLDSAPWKSHVDFETVETPAIDALDLRADFRNTESTGQTAQPLLVRTCG